MNLYRITLEAKSAFATPLVGDTLFGQLCWGIVNRYGEDCLQSLLKGYAEKNPFMVVSDAFPSGYLPLPTLPSKLWATQGNEDRKALKKKRWIALTHLTQPLSSWQQLALNDREVVLNVLGSDTPYQVTVEQMHNTVNRATNKAGQDAFAASYVVEQICYPTGLKQDLYVLLDETRFSRSDFEQVLKDIGQTGYGKDASIGMGKFDFTIESFSFDSIPHANAWLTLSNSAPQTDDCDVLHSYYQIVTRFGRHGQDLALTGKTFKKPIILVKTAALLTPKSYSQRSFIGQGLTSVSWEHRETVHQGYAPVLPVCLTIHS
ncbi:hypothetical protein IX83_05660 [Basilea psittacipulmonis DSM 24701]|uniref:CRISPR system Cms protein Csm4 n=2 Tax=Basilea TaxID=1472344 RepID=A0A077DHB0_9BURK|nr:hypothetical protein IX83_05660 [Basilea psittacipulmonis DSM 24701]